MRLNPIYFKSRHHAKAAQNENKVPIKVHTPLILKNKVSGSGGSKAKPCLYETSLVLKCWQENEFNDSSCKQYMDLLNNCYSNYLKNTAAQRELQKIDVPAPYVKSMTNKQMSYLLRRYPTV